MKTEFPQELKELAEIFPARLYVVGGAVRDVLLGYKPQDYDLASSAKAEDVLTALGKTRFRAEHNSLKLGTLSIRGNVKYEYTAFRKDSYTGNGKHEPEKVEFVDDVEVDARRRDFTVNAIYIDVLSGEVVDPTDGQADLKNKLIRTVRAPQDVVAEDALRIMRMARFASSLGFEADKELIEVCKFYAESLRLIAAERIKDELNKILVADTVYGIKGAHIRGLELLREIGALEIILPEVYAMIGVEQNRNYHAYDVYNHTLRAVEALPPELRLVGLMHDVGKPTTISETGKATGHDVYGAELTRKIMGRLRYSNEQISRAVALVRDHMFDIDGTETDVAVREFVQAKYKEIPDLITLKIADWNAGGVRTGVCPSAERLRRVYDELIVEGVPFEIRDLPVSGGELESLGVEPSDRGKILKELLKKSASDDSLRTRDGAIGFIKNRISGI